MFADMRFDKWKALIGRSISQGGDIDVERSYTRDKVLT